MENQNVIMQEIYKAYYRCNSCGKKYTRKNETTNRPAECPNSQCRKWNNPFTEVKKKSQQSQERSIVFLTIFLFDSNTKIISFLFAGNDVQNVLIVGNRNNL